MFGTSTVGNIEAILLVSEINYTLFTCSRCVNGNDLIIFHLHFFHQFTFALIAVEPVACDAFIRTQRMSEKK